MMGMDTYVTHTRASASGLAYDPAIYWLAPFYEATYRVWLEVAEDARFDEAETAQQHFVSAIPGHARDAGWPHYTVVEQPYHDTIEGVRLFRRRIYEQPGFTKIHRYAGPPYLHEFRIAVKGQEPVMLELRRLMWHGRPERGALHGTELYVVYADIKPETRGGIKDT